jgi:general secretion pathway protein K
VALLVVALATLLAYAVTQRSALDLRRNEALARAGEARELSLGLEDWALQQLRLDLLDGSGYDSRGDAWAQPLPPLPVPGGVVIGQLEELNGRFNLNSLLRSDGERDGLSHQRLQRMLGVLELSPAIADAVADWIDADSTVSGAGAEDLDYLRANPPYRAANRPMVHLGELRWVQGVDEEIYQRLRPHVTVLPGSAELNLNTATLPVWRSLHPAISDEVARRLSNNGRADHSTVNEIYSELERAGITLAPTDRRGLGVRSEYFLARAQVKVGSHAETFYSLLQRNPEGGRVLQRSRGLYD